MLHKCTTVGVFVWRRFESWHVFFFFLSSSFLSVYVWKCDEGFVHFLHLAAKSPSAFQKNGPIFNILYLDDAN